ncbi:Uncharacterised protein [Rodentibacter pneumotropicus]|uniref:Uncharacterized protein n=1 Tax=Rodentibacter pneumotropicus TaxID=758 RepID=A0A3S4TYJ2_9PAST|nr:Uncharacterised protein [Rodentibacter pneumotropicus]
MGSKGTSERSDLILLLRIDSTNFFDIWQFHALEDLSKIGYPDKAIGLMTPSLQKMQAKKL